jgi:hypothetical protein
VYETPEVDLPLAPAGAQNAPGVTINELLVAIGVGVGVIVGVVPTVGVGVGAFGTPRPQESINVFNFVASFISTVNEYLTFIAIQFSE